jgi:Holliday junction resolvase
VNQNAEKVGNVEKENVRIELPFVPPSVNCCYRSIKSRIYLSSRLRDFQKKISAALHDKPNILGPVSLDITFYFTDKRSRDLDNLLKPLIDGLKNVVIEDDSLIYRITCEKRLGQESNKTIINITNFLPL